MDAGASLSTWQQAFEGYPISTTKAIEKQLRSNISNNKEKLRALVGGNYRELLSTAEQIIALDTQTKDAEAHISALGQRCHPPAYQRTQSLSTTKGSRVAQLRLLHRCLNQAYMALTKLELLLCAKLTAVARLLLKSLSDHESIMKSLNPMRNKLASIRRRLLRAVDVFLSRPSATAKETLEAGCAYCLVTSASSEDVFKHIQHLRLERLRQSLAAENLTSKHFVGALRYQLSSLQLLKSVSARQFDDALQRLQKRPILEDPVLVEEELLCLSETVGIIPEEIRSFTPYLKQKPLTSEEVNTWLDDWSSSASQLFAPALEDAIPESWTTSDILDLRKQLYSQLLPVYFSIPASSVIRETLAHATLTHLGQQCSKLREQLAKHSEDVVRCCASPNSAGSLWQPEMVSMRLNGGAASYLNQVHSRRVGTSKSLAKVTRSIRTWVKDVENTKEQYDRLRKTRWRDMIEEPEDEQEEDAAQILADLTRNDPDAYMSDLREALKDSFEQTQDTMVKACSRCINQSDGADEAVALLRAIRESMRPLRQAFKEEAKFEDLDKMMPELHQVVAKQVLQNTLAALEGIDHKSPSTSLENMPSPKVFQVLQQLCREMTKTGGTDVWSPPAIRTLKTVIAQCCFNENRKRFFTDNAFDEAYLAAALNHAQDAPESDKGSLQAKAARDYWNRTKLLFGILG